MKPVIKKQTHYTLLLMKDDSNARTFRLHSSVLRFLICFFLALLIGGGAGIAGGLHYWHKYRQLSSRHDALDRETAEIRLQLERLSNLECLLVASNGTPAPQTRNEEVGASPRLFNSTAGGNASLAGTSGALNATAAANATTAVNATLAANAAGPANATLAAAGTRDDANRAQNNATQRAEAGKNGDLAESESAPTLAGSNATAQLATVDGRQVLPLESGDSPVRIDGFHARPCIGPQRLCLSYELSTVNPEETRTPIIGTTRYTAVFNNGAKLELPLQDSDGTRFNIQRMKPMRSSARLPQSYPLNDLVSIDVYVDISDGGLYLQNLPFTQ